MNDPDCDWGSHSSSPCLNPPDPEFAGGQIDWMTPKEDLFIKTSDRHLAQQLTLIESQLFCRIKASGHLLIPMLIPFSLAS